MKHYIRFMTMMLLTAFLAFAACGGGGGGDNGGGGDGLSAGDTETYTADGVSFVMAYVPGGKTFPTGVPMTKPMPRQRTPTGSVRPK